ncbi:MAG: 3-deoxy-D-manno-octulosonic acid transferase [Bacteroidetes bacterium]|nr:3-deoxy-D-manno-octulosonic acid transferase [Fibrella sp.]
MSKLIYLTGIHLYQFLIWLVSPVNPKARRWVKGRQNWLPNLKALLHNNTAPLVWFHAASLGEFEQGRPVMEAFRAQYPTHKILLTFFSPSGYEVRKNYTGADYIVYLPADTPANAQQFVAVVKPVLAFFIKYEFWHFYLSELKIAGVPTVSFSAIFRPSQIFFRWYGGFYRAILRQFTHLLVQNQESVALLTFIDSQKVTLAGDTRFDRVTQVAAARRDIPLAAAFKRGDPLLVIGSAWPADMDVLIPFLNQFTHPLKVIIAPHELHDADIERWCSQLTKPSVRYSQLIGETSLPSTIPFNQLIIDNVGMLSSLYQYGEYAYIGGGFGKGLHNSLEAATFGVPLLFGPNYTRFQEAVALVSEGAAFPVTTTTELTAALSRLYTNPDLLAKTGTISRDYVRRNIGATAKVMDVVDAILPEKEKTH